MCLITLLQMMTLRPAPHSLRSTTTRIFYQKFNSPEQTGGVWGKHLYQLMYLHPGGANKTISFSLVSLIPTSITLTWLLQSLQCMIWYTCDLPGIINNNNNMMLDESWESEQQQLWWQMMMMTTGLIMNEMMNLKLWMIYTWNSVFCLVLGLQFCKARY